MTQRETEMTRWYWKEQVGGLLIEEFTIVRGTKENGRRVVDGLIVLGEKKKRMTPGSQLDITGKDVVILQTKNSRLGMYLMGQTFFSAKLIRRLKPRSVKSVALCASDDAILRPMLEAYKGCEVVVCPENVCQKAKTGNT
jgi:hypothetical protein